jgi:sugar phosphate isomerase/epimerase
MTALHNPSRTFLTCFSTMGCTELTLPQVLTLADQFSIDCLELRSLENRIDLPAYLAEQPGGLPAIRSSLSRHPARVLGTSFKLVGDTEAGRTTLLSFAQLAEQIGTPYLRIFGGGTWGTPLMDENYRQAVEVLNWWQEQKKKNKWQVEILIETHDAFSASPPLLKLFELLGRTHPIIWDSHHTWRLAGETPADSWKHLKPHTRHVHIKDSILKPSARHPYTYVLPGTGEMPARQVLDLLQKDNFNGAVSLEWEKMWHPYLTPIQDALSACQKEKWW